MRREIEHRWRELGEFVREQRRLGQLSLRRLSELSGISNPYLSQIERGLRRPSAEILQQLARALQISAETLYVRAGILEDRSPGDDLLGAIRRSPELSEDQKRTLIHVYQSFRADNPRPGAGSTSSTRPCPAPRPPLRSSNGSGDRSTAPVGSRPGSMTATPVTRSEAHPAAVTGESPSEASG